MQDAYFERDATKLLQEFSSFNWFLWRISAFFRKNQSLRQKCPQ